MPSSVRGRSERTAYKIRCETRKRLAAEKQQEGMSAKEAHQEALTLVPEPKEPPETAITDLVEAAEWVMEALGRRPSYVKKSDCPTNGTWALYEWAKENRNKFFENVWPKALAVKQKRDQGGDEDLLRRERRAVRELAEQLRVYWDELKHSDLNEFGLPE